MRKIILCSCLTVFLAVLVASGCSSDTPVSSVTPLDVKILVLEDDGSQDTLYAILSYPGFVVTQGGPYYDYTGTDFSAYDLVIFLNGIEYLEVMEDSIQQALMDYVTAGGVLLTTEWLLEEGYHIILESFLPVAHDASFEYESETYTKMVDHPITANIPNTFVTNSDWCLSYMTAHPSPLSSNIQVLFEGSTSGPALVIGDLGSGHTIHWAMGLEYIGEDIWSAEVRQIFLNIAFFSVL